MTFPFIEFEVDVLNHLKFVPFQLNPLSWALVKVFPLWYEFECSIPTFNLFFYQFHMQRKSSDGLEKLQGFVYLKQAKK